MRIPIALLATLSLVLSGCLGTLPGADEDLDPAATGQVTTVFERASLPFVLDDEFSRTLTKGTFGILDVQSVTVDVTLPVIEGGSAADASAKVHMGVWLPDVPAGTKVPVIADVGPYYEDGDVAATEPANRLGRFLIENFVPHGYAVAQVSVLGSGASTHCMDLMGEAEQAGIDAAVTYLGTEEWSNGAVGLIGRSYDGSTPWEAATFGNEHLKTIVPISGLIGMHELMWRNGSAEFRGPIMHNVVYGTFGVDFVKVNPFAVFGDPASAVSVDPTQDPAEEAYNLCPDYLTGPVNGLGAYVTGDHFAPEVNSYWKERYFLDRALENYDGSVYFIHGLQDWNVDPHMAFPTYHKLQDAGVEVKGLFGQWAHMYPDRHSEHENLPEGRGAEAYPATVRLDWAQDLLEWFDHYLKGTGPKPALHVEVQDNMGGWRVEESYPPRDLAWTEVPLSGMTLDGNTDIVAGVSFIGIGPQNTVTFTVPPLSETEDVRIAGLPQFHPEVVPIGPGGQLFALLEDAETGLRLGHAIMDLRFAEGGMAMKPVIPGQKIVAKMEFFGMDVVIPAGHALRLTLSHTGEDYLPSAVTAPVEVLPTDASVLRIPIVTRGDEAFFTPPGVDASE